MHLLCLSYLRNTIPILKYLPCNSRQPPSSPLQLYIPIFIYHEDASGKNSFKRTGDAYAVDEQNLAFAVADSPIRCLVRDTKNYPHDDHGFEAASTFCNSFIKFIAKRKNNKNFNKQTF